MATQARGLIRDQNLNVHFDVAPQGAKAILSKLQKNGGGLGGRKALNDISNSVGPSALNTSKKHNSKNVVSVGEEIGSSKIMSSFGGKKNVSKAPEKGQAGGRKALSDLTNSGKPCVQQASKHNKLGAVVEEDILSHNVAQEQLLHNHQKCIKAQQKGIDIDYFLKAVGLENAIQNLIPCLTVFVQFTFFCFFTGNLISSLLIFKGLLIYLFDFCVDNSMRLASPPVSPLSAKLKAESPPRYMEIEDMTELLYVDQYQRKEVRLPSEPTSPCGSPKSPNALVMWNDYNFPNFTLMKSP